MTADALLIVQTLFGVVWKLFTGWKIPGTNTTPAGWFLFIGMAVLVLRFLKSVLPGLSTAFLRSHDSGSKGDS